MVIEIAGNFYELSGIEIIGHLSFAFAAMSFFVRDMLFLRSFAIISGVVGITFNYFIQVGPLWIPIFWLSFFICINGYRIVGIILERRSINFTEEELELHETV